MILNLVDSITRHILVETGKQKRNIAATTPQWGVVAIATIFYMVLVRITYPLKCNMHFYLSEYLWLQLHSR